MTEQKNPDAAVGAGRGQTENQREEPIMTSIPDTTDERQQTKRPDPFELLCQEPRCIHYGTIHDELAPMMNVEDVAHTAAQIDGDGWFVVVESGTDRPEWVSYATANWQQTDTVEPEIVESFLGALRAGKVLASTMNELEAAQGVVNERRRFQLEHPELFGAQSAEASS